VDKGNETQPAIQHAEQGGSSRIHRFSADSRTMSELTLYSAATKAVLLQTRECGRIRDVLKQRGIGFERWPAQHQLDCDASIAQILATYKREIEWTQERGNFPSVDAIRVLPDHPDRESLRQKFLKEHVHAEDEVRFFVEGCGLFCLHIGDEVVQVLCETNDWISVPAGTRHWFDMGAKPRFCTLRFFNNPSGWVAEFTGDTIADRYPRLSAS
tara:strand:+ start:102 stop:740 length:639 start_codon:yes stop_codon:yes gene_type:complete